MLLFCRTRNTGSSLPAATGRRGGQDWIYNGPKGAMVPDPGTAGAPSAGHSTSATTQQLQCWLSSPALSSHNDLDPGLLPLPASTPSLLLSDGRLRAPFVSTPHGPVTDGLPPPAPLGPGSPKPGTVNQLPRVEWSGEDGVPACRSAALKQRKGEGLGPGRRRTMQNKRMNNRALCVCVVEEIRECSFFLAGSLGGDPKMKLSTGPH
ncbi:uncharacterized protein LOC115651092 [Gopherus evgoodei]|uniref:uncharacterized protein LOC115651092 n=1 Tax=Gopherus evgoodei TaxID=1825980 RepID=UPI0011CF2E5D|nr:uncharacterized protein LOC115651092 [Gopherus evgoodei]